MKPIKMILAAVLALVFTLPGDALSDGAVRHYTIMVQKKAGDGNWDELWFTSFLVEELGIKLDAIEVPAECWTEKKELAFMTNMLPDLFVDGLTDSDVITYGSAGVLIDLADWIRGHAPNVQKLFDENPAYKAALTAPNGGIYYLKGFSSSPREHARARVYVNTKWIETLGLQIPQTLEEFYNVLVAMKHNDPNGNGLADEIPVVGMVGKKGDNDSESMSISSMILAAYGVVDDRVMVDSQTGRVVFVPETEAYRNYLIYMNRLYAEGLLDQEYYSQTADQRAYKITAGRCGVIPTNAANWTDMPDRALYEQYHLIPPLTSETNETKMWPAYDLKLSGGFAITRECEEPEPLIALLDYLMTEQGSINQRLGPEIGVAVPNGGIEYITQNDVYGVLLHYPEPYLNFNDYRAATLTTQQFPYYWPYQNPYHLRFDERQVDLTTQITQSYLDYLVVPYPSLLMTEEEIREMNVIEDGLEGYIRQMEGKFVTGMLSFELYDEFLRGCEDRSSARYIALKQQTYDRYCKNADS